MKTNLIYLSKKGYRLLKKYSTSTRLSLFNRRRLKTELENARVMNSDNLPLNIVSSDSSVLISNLEKGHTFSIRIASLPGTIATGNVIPLTDSLALALLGYWPGAIVPWEFEQRIQRLKVLSVYDTKHQ